MKGQIKGNVIVVKAPETFQTQNGGSFTSQHILVIDNFTNPQYPAYYDLQFSGDKMGIVATFQPHVAYLFDVEYKGRLSNNKTTGQPQVFGNFNCWNVTPVENAQHPYGIPQAQPPAVQQGFYTGQPAPGYNHSVPQPGGAGNGQFSQPNTFGGQSHVPGNIPGQFGAPATNNPVGGNFNPGYAANQGFGQTSVPQFAQPAGNGFGQPANTSVPANNANQGFNQPGAVGMGTAPASQPIMQQQPNGGTAPLQPNEVADSLPF